MTPSSSAASWRSSFARSTSGRRWQAERGTAMVIVMALATLVSAVLIGVVVSSSTDLTIATAFVRGAEADAAADAAIARAVVDLAGLPDWTPVLDGTVTSTFTDGLASGVRTSPGGVFVDLDLVPGLATCGHPPPCSEAERTAVTGARPWGANNPRWRLFAWGPLAAMVPTPTTPSPTAYLLVMVADDPAEADGNPDRDESAPGAGAGLLRLRAEAYAPAGARRVVEVLVARSPVGGVRVLRWSHPAG